MKLILTSLLFFATLFSSGQTSKKINTSELMLDCIKTSGELPNKQMAIWYPYNFWESIGEQMNLSSDGVKKIKENLKEYSMFCIVDYSISNSGTITFKTDTEIRSTIKYTDSSNKVYFPLDDSNISSETKNFIGYLHPFMTKLLGQFGEGMSIILFKLNKDKDSLDLTTKNHFTLSWGSTQMQWKLPFASMLKNKYCPIDNEQMKGNWNFCPEHGVLLKN